MFRAILFSCHKRPSTPALTMHVAKLNNNPALYMPAVKLYSTHVYNVTA